MQTPDATDPRTPLWMIAATFVLAALSEVVTTSLMTRSVWGRPRRPAVPSCCPHPVVPPAPTGASGE